MKKFTQKFVGIAAMFCAISLSSNAQEIGDQAEGGTVFHIDEASGLGYVVASQDLSSGAYDTSQPGDLGYEWGCYGVNVSTGLGIGSGMNNTNLIANNCNSNNGIIAAQAALNHSSGGYEDWFLPSRDEFLAMTSFEDFNDGWYFSSSQFSSTTQAWFVAPNNDDQNASSKKIFTLQVRPIRTFDWSPLVVAECGNQMDGSSRSGGEFCMPCMDGTFSPDDLSDCMSVSECYPGEYETTVPTATSNRVCSPVSECYPDEYETMAPTPTSDRECTVLSTCLSDEFVSMAATTTSDRLCSPVRTICASDEYVSVAASPGFSDIECSPVRSICTSDEYISMAAISGLSDIQCSPVRTSCSSGEFVSVASLPGLSDIECSELRDCTAGEYESVAPTATSNRVCSPVSECYPDEYESVAPTPTSDRECSVLSACLSDEYETMAPTLTSDRACSPVSECYPGEYESMPATVSSNRECSVVRECSDNEYETLAPTATSNRICETIVMGCMDETDYNYNVRANTSDNSCSTACFYPDFMDSNSDFESPNIGPGDVLYVYYNNEYITHFTTSTSDVVSGSTPGYSGYGPRYFGSEHEPGVSYYAGGLSALTSINEANYPYWVGAGDEYIFDTRSFSEGGDTHDGVGDFSWINWTSKNIKISQSRCFGATSCTVDQFELLAPTPTSDRECTVLSTCLSDEFVSMAATTTSDRLCSPIRTICASDEYVSVAASPGLSDIECSPVRSICTSDEYISMAAISGLSDIQCSPVRTSCSSGEFVSVGALPGLFDIECSALSDCTAGEYESMAPTATSDRACSALSECSADEYELVAATTTSDRICETIVKGCTDAAAYNFDSNANTDDGSCETLDLPSGWSMFGYTCMESKDPITAFEGYAEKIIIVKDEMGLSYLPEYNFNALGNLKHTEGYQIKLKERLVGFKFCEPIGQVDVDAAYAQGVASVTPDDGVSQADVDAAEAAVHASYEGWCASDLDNDGICDVDEVSGCMDETACNYNSEAEFDDDSCDYETCLDECGVVNGDNTTCLDCAGVPNGTAEDLGCGCGKPAAQEGYDCEGNEITYQVGDLAHGGMVFYVDETGEHGLVAALEDLGSFEWGCHGTSISGADGQAIGTGYQNTLDIVEGCPDANSAAFNALNATIESYTDWYTPSIDELIEMYNTIGKGGPEGNIGGFSSSWYWSSSEVNNNLAWSVYFNNGGTGTTIRTIHYRVRVIRAF